jgi:2-polyprenyl-6-methoxyphenol hydroxylase-like FAD-dependent oxidoreductase
MSSSVRDVCVVGGGPAGLAAAIALKGGGRDVTVVDCAVPPVDKACGEGLMPDSIAALRELGVELPPDAGFPFRGIRFADRCSSVYADFPTGIAQGVRRTVLHDLLIGHAVRLGISIIWDAKHVELGEGGVRVGDQLFRADYVIGADGQNS